jgi:ligand-binding sensor domain-containing protein
MKWLLVPLLVSLHTCLSAQTSVLERIGIEQGLPQGFVTRLAQDREGFVWMGTSSAGLNRFDGHRFQNFSSNPFDPHSVSGNFIYDIADLGDFLFVGTLWDGPNLFHKRTGRFFHLPFDKLPGPGSQNAVIKGSVLPAPTSCFVARTADGSLWIRSHRHPESVFWLSRMTVPIGFWEQLPHSTQAEAAQWLSRVKTTTWPLQNIFAGQLEDGKTVCRVVDNQLLAWNGDKWRALPAPAEFSAKLDARIPDKIDDEASYWWTHDGEIWRSSGNGASWKQVSAAPPGMFVIQLENDFALTRIGNLYQAFPLEPSPLRIDFSKPLWSVETSDIRFTQLLDTTGNLWFVNNTEGIQKFSRRTAVFGHQQPGNVRFCAPFLTTPEGVLSFFINKDHRMIITGEPKSQAAFIQSAFDNHKIESGFVRSDGKKRVWIGGRKNLLLADLGARITKFYQLPYPSAHPPSDFLVAEDGTLRLPVGGALIHLDPDADTAVSLDFRHEGLDALQIYAIAQTGDGSCWLATDDGLLRIFPEPGERLRTDQMQVSALPQARDVPVFKAKTRLYRTEPANPNSLRNNFTVSLLTDPADAQVLWIGTKGGGLNRFDLRSGQFTHLTTAEGLPDNVIYAVLPDRAGHLWLSSNRGLVRYHPVSGEIKSFRKADGLQDDEFNTSAYGTDARGYLYFGGVKGMNVFDPAKITDNPNKPNVQLTGLKINGKTIEAGDKTGILKENIGFCKKIALAHGQNTVTLEFAALEFTAPTKNTYRYWLKGLETEKEAHIGHEPQATYHGLSPGGYTFVVYGSNNDGVWSDEPATLQIRIRPPWYAHGLAKCLYIAILAGLAAWFWRLRENRRKLEFRLQLEQKELELQAETHRHKLAEMAQQQALEREKAIHEQELNRMKLEELTRHLIEKSQLLEALEQKISGDNGEAASGIDQLRTARLLTQEDWEQFQERFDRVYPGFLERVTARFRFLTPAETRLITLMKLGLSTAEAASMLGVSPDSFKKTRHRLRKKLEARQVNLDDLMH